MVPLVMVMRVRKTERREGEADGLVLRTTAKIVA